MDCWIVSLGMLVFPEGARKPVGWKYGGGEDRQGRKMEWQIYETPAL